MSDRSWLPFIALSFVVIGVIILVFVFMPIVAIEVSYNTKAFVQKVTQQTPAPSPTPASKEFGIVIPKIQANAPIVANVDAFNDKAYQAALTKGIAHAKGTSLPDGSGNVFLFAHSAENWLNANKYNAVFYLLYKLEKGDTFSVFYKGKEYVYQLEEKRTVDAEDVEVMKTSTYPRSVTLMTCWPPGTTLQRYIVVGALKEVK